MFCLLLMLFKTGSLLIRQNEKGSVTSEKENLLHLLTILIAIMIYFDIVGFTEMCQHATPLEVVNVLNGVFDGFDQFIARREAYKSKQKILKYNCLSFSNINKLCFAQYL
uniref:Guanylate cyclase domain-containing protein n=1 Tax=Heterorhabditis bacteriophora TaxID=37862 RepID=A0A1I7W5W2_HETBA